MKWNPVTVASALLLTSSICWPAEVSVDRSRRIVRVDGTPFFPLGCMGVDEGRLEEAAAVGFNCTVRWGGEADWRYIQWLGRRGTNRTARVRQYLDAAHRAGLLVIERPMVLDCASRARDLDWGQPELRANFRRFNQEKLPWIVDAVKDHPALLAYYGRDEPEIGGTDPEWHRLLSDFAEVIRARDPEHPVYLMFGSAIQTAWADAFDVVGWDCYKWSAHRLGLRFAHNPRTAYAAVRREAAKAERLRVPYWHVPLVQRGEPGLSLCHRLLSPEEQRLQTYLAVIGGANGIIWWRWPPKTEAQWLGFRALLRELRTLSPILLEPTTAVAVDYAPESLGVVLPLLVKNHAGHAYLFVANCGRSAVDVRLRLPSSLMRTGERVSVLAGRQIKLSRHGLEDRIEPFASRVYRLARPWPEAGAMRARIRAHPSEFTRPTADLRSLLSATTPDLIHGPAQSDAGKWQQSSRGDPKAYDEHGTSELVTDPHTGQPCLHLRTSEQHGKCVVYESRVPITVEANTRYLFAVRGRMWSEGPAEAVVQLRPLEVESWMNWYMARRLLLPNLTSTPETVGMTFVTWPKSFRLVVHCVLRHGPADAWFEDIILKKLPKSKNLLKNSGFEQEGLPGEPRYWTPGQHTGPGLIGPRSSCWALDRQRRYKGRYSLRLRRTTPPVADAWLEGDMLSACEAIPHAFGAGTVLTLSFYATAHEPGTALKVSFPDYGMAAEAVEPTTEWERYQLTWTLKRDVKRLVVRFSHNTTAGTVWIDTVQVELGKEATEYENGGW